MIRKFQGETLVAFLAATKASGPVTGGDLAQIDSITARLRAKRAGGPALPPVIIVQQLEPRPGYVTTCQLAEETPAGLYSLQITISYSDGRITKLNEPLVVDSA